MKFLFFSKLACQRVAVLAGVYAVTWLAGCGPEQSIEPEPEARTVSSALTQAEISARQAEVDDWLAQRMDGWEIVDTRVTSDEQVIDYVTIESLFPDDPSAPYLEPPPVPALPDYDGQFWYEEELDGDMVQALTAFQTDGNLEPPEGTLPIIRPDFTHYIYGIGLPESIASLEGFFEYLLKPMPHSPLPENVSNNRLYVTHIEKSANTATYGTVSIWDYEGVQAGEMTLLQTANLCWGDDGLNTLEAIELGVQKVPVLYNTNQPHFFVYFRTAGDASGDLSGGYNTIQDGFIPYYQAGFPVGAAFNTTSVVGGTQWECKMGTQLYRGNWWVRACGSWLGYYPGPESEIHESYHIPFDLIDQEACDTQWYGEVVDQDPSVWTTANMGSGQFAGEGWRYAAYIRNMYQGHRDAPSSWFDSFLNTGGRTTRTATAGPRCARRAMRPGIDTSGSAALVSTTTASEQRRRAP